MSDYKQMMPTLHTSAGNPTVTAAPDDTCRLERADDQGLDVQQNPNSTPLSPLNKPAK